MAKEKKSYRQKYTEKLDAATYSIKTASPVDQKKSDSSARAAANTAFNTDSTQGRGRGVSGKAVATKTPKLPALGRQAFDIGRAATGRGRGVSSPVSATPVPKPKARPSVAPPKPVARPSFNKGSSSPPAYTPEKAKPQLGKKVSSGFSGNWQGAAPSEMQKRGGARINRGGGILGKLRGK